MKKEIVLFMVILAAVNLGLGLSDNVLNNYLKDAYQITTLQRGFVQVLLEIPGILGAFLIVGFSFLGDMRWAVIAQIFALAGLAVLGFSTPPFAVMICFLFIYSMGLHLFLPLSDGIGLALIDTPEKVGKRMGQYHGVKTLFLMISGAIVFIGFRSGWFSFTTPVKSIFILGSVFFLTGLVLFLLLHKMTGKKKIVRGKGRMILRKEYIFYYILAVLNGVQKQIMLVYGPWVLIELLDKKADTIALLSIAGALAGVFFIPAVGRWIDRFGIKKMLYFDALSFIFVYVSYGILSGFAAGPAANSTVLAVLLFAMFIIDRMSMQMGMVKVVYLNRIAVSPSEVTGTLSIGISMDHVVSIVFAYLGGLIWTAWGPQYVFYIAGAFSLINLFVAAAIRPETLHKPAQDCAGEETQFSEEMQF